MKQKHFVVLAAAAILLVIVALWSSHTNDAEKNVSNGGLLLPDLRTKIDHVADIRVATRGGDNVTQIALQKKGEHWIVADKNYHADTQKLSALVNALVQAKRIEAKTAKAEHHVKLGVVDPARAGEGTGTLLRLLQADGTPVFELIVGGAPAGRNGRYVRIAGDNQVWLIDRNPDVATGLQDWLDRSIADVAPQDIVAVDFGGLVLKRPAPDKELELAAMPAGRELSYDGVTATAAAALSQLQLKDVTASGAINFGKAVARAVFTTRANVVVTVDAWRLGDRNYLKLAATAAERADDGARKQVDVWNTAWQPWVFEVETFTYNRFVKSINDFTKEKPKLQKAG